MTDLLEWKPAGRCRGADCVALLIAQDRWKAIPRDTRDRWRGADVFAQHAARGLCRRCYRRAEHAGALIDHEPRHRPADERGDDYTAVRPNLPNGSTLERLLHAGKLQGDPHPNTLRRALRITGTRV